MSIITLCALLCLGLLFSVVLPGHSDSLSSSTQAPSTTAPAVQPSTSLAQHNFLYAGEAKTRQLFIVRGGKVVWSYEDPNGKGEISDATMLSNGNIVFAHQYGVEEITPDKKIIWNYPAPPGTEIHTAVPIGNKYVLFIENGNPALVKVVNIVTGQREIEFRIPVGNPNSIHGQFRHARITPDGLLLVAHMDMGKISEYNAQGSEVWSLDVPGVWGANPLPNGNILVADKAGIQELDKSGNAVWALSQADLPQYKLQSLQQAWLMPNGNILFNSWFNEWSGKVDKANPPYQALEVTRDKKVVWVLNSWDNPDLGPSTTIQVLDQPTAPENVKFGALQ